MGEETKVTSATCEKHGAFEFTSYKVAGRWMGGFCPKCKQDREKTTIQGSQKRKAGTFQLDAQIPRRYSQSSFDNYLSSEPDPDQRSRQIKIKNVCNHYALNFAQHGLGRGIGMMLLGKVGTGKTHLACAIAKSVLDTGYSVRYTTQSDMLEDIKTVYSGAFKASEQSVIRKYTSVDLLIIDEAGMGHDSETDRYLLTKIMVKRDADMLPSLILSNSPKDQLYPKLGTRLESRLSSMATLYFTWSDYRLQSQNSQNSSDESVVPSSEEGVNELPMH